MSTVPQELNWVEKRASCTIDRVFNQLCDGIKDDVNTVNSVLQLRDYDKFQANMHSSGTTIIIGQPERVPRKRMYVGIVGERIQVSQEWDGNKWDVSIGLNNEGRCILRLDESTELEQWQFRKKALEGLFFGDWRNA